MDVKDKSFSANAFGSKGVEYLKEVIICKIQETEKTKRLIIFGSMLLFITASFILVFAPQDRETTSIAIGVSLIVLALGAIGITSFKLKGMGINLQTDVNELVQEAEQTGNKKTNTNDDFLLKKYSEVTKNIGVRKNHMNYE